MNAVIAPMVFPKSTAAGQGIPVSRSDREFLTNRNTSAPVTNRLGSFFFLEFEDDDEEFTYLHWNPYEFMRIPQILIGIRMYLIVFPFSISAFGRCREYGAKQQHFLILLWAFQGIRLQTDE